MGRRGPPPQTPDDAKLRGTFRPFRHGSRANAVKPDGELADEQPPEWMTSEQQAAWRDILARVPFGVVRQLDRELFAAYVVTWVRFKNAAIAQNTLDNGKQFPLIRPGPNGLIESPFVGIQNRASMLLLRQAVELGFSPAARARLASDGFAPAKPEAPQQSWSRLQRYAVIEGDKA
jgi:P27 family predicted phage terminase small subunit